MSNGISNSMMLVLALYRYKNKKHEGKLRNLRVRLMLGTLHSKITITANVPSSEQATTQRQ